jgi:hypothetical protein
MAHGQKPLTLTGFAQKDALAQEWGILHKKSYNFLIGNINIHIDISYK